MINITALDKEFDEYDLREINDIVPEDCQVAYSYSCGSYEGSGCLGMRKDDKVFIIDLSHCSCYGPLDRARTPSDKDFRELEEVINSPAYTDIYDRSTKEVVDFLFNIKQETN